MPESGNKKQAVRGALVSRLVRGKNGDEINTPFFAGLIVIVLLVLGGLWLWLPGRDSGSEVGIVDDVSSELIHHPLTGAHIDEDVHPAVFAVMVENSLDAWPQSGVEDAFLIYEAPVEGNITRWLALFSADKDVNKIGPVRSARPYYVDWATEWSALYAHVGGSPQALEDISNMWVFDLNEFYNASSFWRARLRSAPHNVYTATDRLQDAWDRIVNEDVTYPLRTFKDPCSDCEQEAHDIVVEYNGFGYDVVWKYDPKTNQYTRWQNGYRHRVVGDVVLHADNIVVMKTRVRTIDDVGRKDLQTVGDGKMILLQDGQIIEGTWSKASRQEPTEFFGADGQEIMWNPGVTWIQVMDEDRFVTYQDQETSEMLF